MKYIIAGEEFDIDTNDKEKAGVACSWAHLPKESHTSIAGITVRWTDVCKLLNLSCPDILVVRDQDEAESEEGWENISISQLETEIANNDDFKDGVEDVLRFIKPNGIFLTEKHSARLVFNNHTTIIEWHVAKKWRTGADNCYFLSSRCPETFVSSLTVTGFIRDSELPAFLRWFEEKIPEFKGNEAHKRNHNWAIDDVKMSGGSYHTAWHVRLSDDTPAGEYHRHVYLHETGSGKLSWNPSGVYDPYDLITILRMKSNGELEEWNPSDIFDMSAYIHPVQSVEAPEESPVEEAV